MARVSKDGHESSVASILRDACGACHRARIRATRWQAPQDEVRILPHPEEPATGGRLEG
jgi:hypothetical protein